jgi:hypothetical protein
MIFLDAHLRARMDEKSDEIARPHPSPLLQGEGEISAAYLENRVAGFAGRSSTKPEARDGCSFSQGEKVRMRASQTTNFPSQGSLRPSFTGAK